MIDTVLFRRAKNARVRTALQRIVHEKTWQSRKAGVMSPDLAGAIFKGRESYLEIKNARALYIEARCQARQPFPKSFPADKNGRPLFRRGSAAREIGMCHDTPKLRDRGERDAPPTAIGTSLLYDTAGRPVLRTTGAMGIY